MKKTAITFSLIVFSVSGLFADTIELKSPDENFLITFTLKDFQTNGNCPCYRVAYKGRPVIIDSRLGLDIEGAPMRGSFGVVDSSRSFHDSTWEPVCGERAEIRDHYNQLAVELEETQPPNRRLILTFRAYNEGAAFRYTLPEQNAVKTVHINREHTEFRFDNDYEGWITYSGQGEYEKAALSMIKPGCERPLVIETAENLFVSLTEACLVDYARMKFARHDTTPHCLISSLDGPVTAALPLKTPWRVIMAAESPGTLLENNHIILNLNEPCAIKDTSWIKSGKVIREVTLTTDGGKACVDLAVKQGLQYVEYDAGWYGHEYDDASDATTITVDPKRSKGPLDLHEVIRYAAERDIGIIVYVNRRALEKQLDDLLPLYKKWGIKGIKYGFVNVGTQEWTAWLHEAIRKAAAYGFMVDVHDEYRPTGYSRTYPNLMTMEGIRGDEARPPLSQTLTYAFTRMIAGQADNTVCYYSERVDSLWSHAAQLAKPVCMFSPWQFLFWYDRPEIAPRDGDGGVPSRGIIGDEPELAFFKHVPTIWDHTKVIHGRIGEYAVIARRSGEEWFIGYLNAENQHTFDVPLDFLDRNRQYTAHIYRTDSNAPTRTHVKIEQVPVTGDTVLTDTLPANDGMAVRLVPVP